MDGHTPPEVLHSLNINIPFLSDLGRQLQSGADGVKHSALSTCAHPMTAQSPPPSLPPPRLRMLLDCFLRFNYEANATVCCRHKIGQAPEMELVKLRGDALAPQRPQEDVQFSRVVFLSLPALLTRSLFAADQGSGRRTRSHPRQGAKTKCHDGSRSVVDCHDALHSPHRIHHAPWRCMDSYTNRHSSQGLPGIGIALMRRI